MPVFHPKTAATLAGRRVRLGPEVQLPLQLIELIVWADEHGVQAPALIFYKSFTNTIPSSVD
jgi:hypothetical protein